MKQVSFRAAALLLPLTVATVSFAALKLPAQDQKAKPETPAQADKPGSGKAADTVHANPALWVVKGPHATIYLFGTIHVMKPNVDWHTDKLKTALSASQRLVEEVSDPNPSAERITPLIKQYGTDPDHPLSTKITKEDLALLDAAAKQMGAPGEAPFEPLRPWLAGVTLSVLPILKAGYDPKSGVDVTLAAELGGKEKPIEGFETLEQQLGFLADMPLAEEVESLHLQLKSTDTSVADLDATVAAWQIGDDDAIAKIENKEFLEEAPKLYQRLIVDRNKTWTEKLVTMLKADDTGTVFVAVGAAHLAGPDGVQKMLAARGYTVTKL